MNYYLKKLLLVLFILSAVVSLISDLVNLIKNFSKINWKSKTGNLIDVASICSHFVSITLNTMIGIKNVENVVLYITEPGKLNRIDNTKPNPRKYMHRVSKKSILRSISQPIMLHLKSKTRNDKKNEKWTWNKMLETKFNGIKHMSILCTRRTISKVNTVKISSVCAKIPLKNLNTNMKIVVFVCCLFPNLYIWNREKKRSVDKDQQYKIKHLKIVWTKNVMMKWYFTQKIL
jgi:hypothetical protein